MMLPETVAPPPATDRPHVIVLGGGVSGLYTARVLVGAGARVTVLERNEVPGGLAAGRERNGNYYDFGVHQLHASDQAIFEDIQAIMGERLIPVEKQALIRYGQGFRRYPLKFYDLITGVPPWTLARALVGLMAQQLINRWRRRPPANAEEALIQLYGRPLYAFFFRDFTHRYWGIPPAELSAAFVRAKMPRLSAVDVVRNALGRFGVKEDGDAAVESALKNEILWYSRTGARETPLALADYVRRLGGELLLERTAVGIDVARVDSGEAGDGQNRRTKAANAAVPGVSRLRVTGVRYRSTDETIILPCDAVVSTIPLSILIGALRPAAPADVQTAARALRHKPVAVYGYLVQKPRVLDAQYVYYRNRIFHRVAEPANSGMTVTPPGHTVLLAETTCEVGDDRWNGGEATRRQVIADMEAEGLLTADDIVETHVFHDEYAYPIFAHGFESHLARVEAFLATIENLRSTGRQGRFCYPDMKGAMRMGADTASELLQELPKRVRAPLA